MNVPAAQAGKKAGIADCYRLVAIEVPPAKLTLDPKNPRIAMAVADIANWDSMSDVKLVSDDVQRRIRRVLDDNQHHIDDLINSIRQNGFNPINEMIVRRVRGSTKLLVLEGNRRTAAIQHLLGSGERLPAGVRESLESIPVKEFQYRQNGRYAEEEILDVLLGMIHILGPLNWGALEKAHYIYRSYERTRRTLGGRGEFCYDKTCAEQVAGLFPGFSWKKVRGELMVYRVYDQLRAHAYAVNPDRYSLLDMVIRNRLYRKDYLGLDDDTFTLSVDGLEKLNDTFVRPPLKISNPQECRKLLQILKLSGERDVENVRKGIRNVDVMLDMVRQRKRTSRFREQLKEIREQLGALSVSDYRGNMAEQAEIDRIVRLVQRKLMRLL